MRRTKIIMMAGMLVLAGCQAADQLPKKHGAPPEPSAAEQRKAESAWVDDVKTVDADNVSYHTYNTPARGVDSQGSYLIRLPKNYEQEPNRRYPVIYWLHGGFGNQREGLWAMAQLGQAMDAGQMPQAIIVSPQALPMGWYVNSHDGQRPIENVLIQNLIPSIDAKYRTNPRSDQRGIEGMSMGGYGALHLGLKYPEIFGAVSAVAPSILKNLSDEPSYRTLSTFGTDQNLFAAQSPWGLLQSNNAAIKARHGVYRLLSGDDDARLTAALKEFGGLLLEQKLDASVQNVLHVGHDYREIIKGIGSANAEFWRKAFKNP